MTNNKQKQTNKKRIGLYLGLGLGLAAIVAGSTTAIAITLSKEKDIPSNKVKLIAGANHIFSTNQSSVLVECKGSKALGDLAGNLKLCDSTNPQKTISDFVGWAYTSDFRNGKVSVDKIIPADTKIKEKSSLTAVYKNAVEEEGITWKTVSFERGSSAANANITGNTKFNIISGTCLREINTPVCTPKTAGEMKFVDWKKMGDTTAFGRNVPITSDTKFEPILSAAAKITFIPATGSSIVGSDTVTVSEGTKFSEINTPVVECTDSENNIFFGWYEDAACTKLFPGDKQITSDNVKAYAKIVGKTDPNITVVNTDTTQSGVVYEGNTSFAIPRNAVWSSYNRPIPKAENKKLTSWQYQISGSAEWKTALADTTFGDVGNVTIRPVFESTISGVTITSDFDTVAKNNPTKITAMVLPSTVSQTVSWKIFSDKDCKTEITDTSLASIDANGNLTVKDAYTEPAIYVQAISELDSTKKGSKGFAFANPYEDSTQFWTLNTDAASGYALGWYRLENLCDAAGTTNIELWKEGQTTATKSIDRTTFNQKIYVGDKVTSIPSNFLNGCSTFNSTIEFTGIKNADYSIRIGDNFLAGAKVFNQTLDVSRCLSIGANFLYNAAAFAQPLTLTNIYTIGDNFLNLASYNQTITLGDNIDKIGNGFLQGAKAYNKNITLPASITNIGSQFMFECDSFASTDDNTGTITANCPLSAFDTNVENLSTKDSDAAIYKTGFKVAGSLANTFPYKTINGTLGGYYRKNLTTKEIQSVVVKTSGQLTEFKVGEQFSTSGLVLTVTYDDLSTTDVSSGWTSSPYSENHTFTTENIGDGQTITITYGGKSITYTIDVKDQEVDPTKLPEYLEAINQEDGTIFIKVKDGQTENVPEVLTINSSYKGDDGVERNVTGILDNGFKGCTILSSIKLPTGMLTINGQAFEGCSELQSVTLPSTLTTIGTGVFTGCEALKSIELPSSLKRIEQNAFYGSGITTFTIPSSVLYIGQKALNPDNLESLTFNDTTSSWSYVNEAGETNKFVPTGNPDFDTTVYKELVKAAALTKDAAEDLPVWFEVEQIELSTDYKIKANSEYTGTELTNLTINSQYKLEDGTIATITAIADDGFNGKQIETIVSLPNTLTSIGVNAFADNTIESVTIPDSVKTIGKSAFAGDPIGSVTIPASVTSIGSDAFYTLDSETSEAVLGLLTFEDTSAWTYTDVGGKEATFTPDTTEEGPVNNAATYNSTLHTSDLTKQESELPEYFLLKETGRDSGEYTLSLNTDYEGEIPSELEIKSSYKDGGVDKKVVRVEGFDVTALETKPAITKITINEGIFTIGGGCFINVDTLQEITIPTSVTDIGVNALNTDKLETFNIPASHWHSEGDKTADFQFTGTSETDLGLYKTYVANALSKTDLPSYLELDYDSGYYIKLKTEVTEETPYTGPKELVLHDSYYVDGELKTATYIPTDGFKNAGLTSIQLPSTLIRIGSNVFTGCVFTEIRIPASLTEIVPDAIPDTVTSMIFADVEHYWENDAAENFTPTGDYTLDATNFKALVQSYPLRKQS